MNEVKISQGAIIAILIRNPIPVEKKIAFKDVSSFLLIECLLINLDANHIPINVPQTANRFENGSLNGTPGEINNSTIVFNAATNKEGLKPINKKAAKTVISQN